MHRSQYHFSFVRRNQTNKLHQGQTTSADTRIKKENKNIQRHITPQPPQSACSNAEPRPSCISAIDSASVNATSLSAPPQGCPFSPLPDWPCLCAGASPHDFTAEIVWVRVWACTWALVGASPRDGA